jgi:hypothetical protein
MIAGAMKSASMRSNVLRFKGPLQTHVAMATTVPVAFIDITLPSRLLLLVDTADYLIIVTAINWLFPSFLYNFNVSDANKITEAFLSILSLFVIWQCFANINRPFKKLNFLHITSLLLVAAIVLNNINLVIQTRHFSFF